MPRQKPQNLPEFHKTMSQTLIEEGAPLDREGLINGLAVAFMFLEAQNFNPVDIKKFLEVIVMEAIEEAAFIRESKFELINEIKETLDISEKQLSLDEIRKAAQALGISMPPK